MRKIESWLNVNFENTNIKKCHQRLKRKKKKQAKIERSSIKKMHFIFETHKTRKVHRLMQRTKKLWELAELT